MFMFVCITLSGYVKYREKFPEIEGNENSWVCKILEQKLQGNYILHSFL